MSDANDPRSLTDAQLRAGMLFPGNRDAYAKELNRRSAGSRLSADVELLGVARGARER
jgi:hypothetical protein